MYIRSNRPGAGDKYFIRKASGGFSSCIQGSPTDPSCDVLANCVGFANGAFNETCENGYEKYYLNCNAENFIERAISLGLKVQKTPVKGGVMVWQKGATLSGSDGAGHVAYVSKDEREMGAGRVYTSESGYGGSAFWNSTRSIGNGNWGAGADYYYRGCIVNPNVKDDPTPTPTPTPSSLKVGDIVRVNRGAKSYTGITLAGFVYDNVYRIDELSGDRAVLDLTGICTPVRTSDLTLASQPAPTPTPTPAPSVGFQKGDRVRLIGKGNANSYGTGISTASFTIGWEREVLNDPEQLNGRAKPIQVGNATGTTGWYAADALEKI